MKWLRGLLARLRGSKPTPTSQAPTESQSRDLRWPRSAGIDIFHTENPEQLLREHRRKTSIIEPKLPKPILDYSRENRIYIYNTSFWHYQQDMGSVGSFFIPALAVDDCLKGNAVRCPRPVDGLPFEFYPSEENLEGRVLFHMPPPVNSALKRANGDLAVHFAMEILDQGKLLKSGCFVSKFEHPEPENHEWNKQVAEAEGALRLNLAAQVDAADSMWEYINKSDSGMLTYHYEGPYLCAKVLGLLNSGRPWIEKYKELYGS